MSQMFYFQLMNSFIGSNSMSNNASRISSISTNEPSDFYSPSSCAEMSENIDASISIVCFFNSIPFVVSILRI